MAARLSGVIEHTLLRANGREAELARLCAEAREHGFVGVCVNPVHVRGCADRLAGTGVRVVTVVGFPLGAGTTDVKAFEAERAVASGADELDMVLPIGALLDGDDRAVRRDIEAVVRAAAGKAVKVILETAWLGRDAKVRACVLARDAGAAFVKTSTGFGPGGATVEDVRLLRASVGDALGVKAAGGIRDAATARAMLEAGANRIGTSAGVAIIQGDSPGA
ncbi:MAG: deoxyribose-phosphate aldolase [Myxococcota bacterium]